MKSLVAMCVLALVPRSAFARVFDFKNDTFASYVGGSFGNSSIGNGAYGLSGGQGMSFDKKPLSETSAEVGLSTTLGRIALRLGVDYVWPRTQTGVIGTDAADVKMYEITTEVSSLAFMANLELIGYKGATSRALLGVGYGSATVSLSNEYTMKTTVEIADESVAKTVVRLVEGLEDNDDVQDVFANFDIPEQLLEAIIS